MFHHIPTLIPAFILIAFFVTFIAVIKVTNYSKGANFEQCNTFIQNVSNPVLYNDLFPNTFWAQHVAEKYLSLPGCYAHCGGSGFELWPVEDTIDRVSLWVVPALILLTHFSFAPVAIWNFPAIVIHAVGDPIDSIWGLLIRIEANRRILYRSKELCQTFGIGKPESEEDETKGLWESIKSSLRYAFVDCLAQPIWHTLFPDPEQKDPTEPTTAAEHIATVAAAYEEYGWQDVLKHFWDALAARSEGEMSNQTTASQQDRQHSPLLEPASKPCKLRDDELKYIQRASHELAKSRQHSQVHAIIPIVSLAISLASAINRTIHQIELANTRLVNETAHSIAVLSLFFVFLPIVAFSGRLGTFMNVSSPIEIIKEMQRKLRMIRQEILRKKHKLERERKSYIAGREQLNVEKELFPPITYPHPSLFDYERDENCDDEVTIMNWSQRASFSGINSTYRPCKHLLPRYFSKYTQASAPIQTDRCKDSVQAEQDITSPKGIRAPRNRRFRDLAKHLRANITNETRSRRLLWYYSVLFVVGGACVPAIFLSATNHADERKVAVGCRTLSWLTIMTLWVVSSILDRVYVPVSKQENHEYALHVARAKWRYTIYKDICIVIPIIILITWVQIGFFNSCWCRSSFSGYINLNPYSNVEWVQARLLWGTIAPSFFLFNLGLIAWILLVGGRSKGVLCRSQTQLRKDAMDLIQNKEKGKLIRATEANADEKLVVATTVTQMEGSNE